MTSLPRVVQDAAVLQEEGLQLQRRVLALEQKVEGVEEQTGQSIKSLQRIDKLKSKLEVQIIYLQIRILVQFYRLTPYLRQARCWITAHIVLGECVVDMQNILSSPQGSRDKNDQKYFFLTSVIFYVYMYVYIL